jgi:predicted transcriptional regulator
MRILAVVIVLIVLIPQVLAFESKPANISDEELQKLIENDAPDEIPISFWELPLWIKLHEIYTRLYWIWYQS